MDTAAALLFLPLNLILLAACLNITAAFSGEKTDAATVVVRAVLAFVFSVYSITVFLSAVLKCFGIVSVCVSVVVCAFLSCITVYFKTGRLFAFSGFFSALKSALLRLWHVVYSDKLILFAAVIYTAAILIKAANLVLLRPYDFDGLKYHLPALVSYIKSGGIYITEGVIWENAYPKNFEMLNMWMLLFFRNGFLVRLPQLLVVFIGGLSIYKTARFFGLSECAGIKGALLCVSVPIIMAQMNTAYVDAALTSFVLASLFTGFDFAARPSVCRGAFFGMALGMLVGIKYSAAAYAAIILIAVFTAALTIHKQKAICAFARTCACVCACALATLVPLAAGCAFYIRNAVVFKNPVFPFAVKIFGHEIFSGVDITEAVMQDNIPEALSGINPFCRVITSWLDLSPDFLSDTLVVRYDERIGGMGILWIIFIPLIILMLRYVIRSKKQSGILVYCAAIAIMFLITPENWWSRYTAFIGAAGALGFAYLSDIKANGKYAVKLFGWLFAVAVTVNCISGTAADVFYLYRYASAYDGGESGFYNSLNDEYEKWLFGEIGEKPCSIISLRPDSGGFNFFGPEAKNDYSWFTYEKTGNAAIDEVCYIRDEKTLEELIRSRRPDYILVTFPYFIFHMDYYTGMNSDYILYAQNGNERIYARIN